METSVPLILLQSPAGPAPQDWSHGPPHLTAGLTRERTQSLRVEGREGEHTCKLALLPTLPHPQRPYGSHCPELPRQDLKNFGL